MRIDHLRYFIALEDAHSFSKAAKASNISQQGFSRAIGALENNLGCKLVERGRQGSQLTSKGTDFIKHAKRIVFEYDTAMLEISDMYSYTKILNEYRGKIAFTNACMVSIGAKLLEKGYLSKAKIVEIGLSDLPQFDTDKNTVVIADISPELYADFESTHQLLPIATGRVGVAVHGRLLPTNAENPLWESLKTLPLAILDCDASLEIYEELFKELQPKDIRIKTGNNFVLERSLAKGELALMCDSFSWKCFPDEIHRNAHIRFIPLLKEMHSIFGLVRKNGLAIEEDERNLLVAIKMLVASEVESENGI